jgi:hypothetical protein
MTGDLGGWIALLTVPAVVLIGIVRADKWLDWRRDRKAMRREVEQVLADAETQRRAADDPS